MNCPARILVLSFGPAILFAAEVAAMPRLRTSPADVTGTIVDLKWAPERKVPGRPGMTSGFSRNRIRPPHFSVTLESFEVVDLDPRRASLFPLAKMRKSEPSKASERITLYLNHYDKHHLRKGMRIRVKTYGIWGDGAGYERIDILPVVMDAGNKVAELDEENNVAFRKVTVVTPQP